MKKEEKKYEETVVSFRFSAESMRSMDEVVKLTGRNEISAVLNALTLYKVLLKDCKKKRRILIENRWGNTKELLIS
jgi:hypothetical protein